MMNRRELGEWGERKALEYLKANHYEIIETNFRSFLGEIDLIVSDGEYLVFVEVKTRKSKNFGTPQEAVDFRKQQKIRRIASIYLAENDYSKLKIRFDVIAICVDRENGKGRLRHFENVF